MSTDSIIARNRLKAVERELRDARDQIAKLEAERPAGFPVPRYHFLDIWLALNGDATDFEAWMDEPSRTPADAWAQLMAAIHGDRLTLALDTNPPAGALLDLVLS